MGLNMCWCDDHWSEKHGYFVDNDGSRVIYCKECGIVDDDYMDKLWEKRASENPKKYMKCDRCGAVWERDKETYSIENEDIILHRCFGCMDLIPEGKTEKGVEMIQLIEKAFVRRNFASYFPETQFTL